jgi:dTDP-4-dehydrorhamnose 3,5-epimerase
MDVIQTSIPGVVIIEPKLFGDHRGFFLETFHAERYRPHGINGPFVQDNLSRSACGVVRGLHLQNPSPQGKLVMVLRGSVLDVAVDVRVGSPTFGQHVTTEINDENLLFKSLPIKPSKAWASRCFRKFDVTMIAVPLK